MHDVDHDMGAIYK